MLKMNQNKLFLFNFKELRLITRLLKNEKEKFLINTNKIHILQEKIKEYI